MNYKIEEIFPIVQKITEKYTGKASTSVTYEKAQQLMGAIIYCIQEYETSLTEVDITHNADVEKAVIKTAIKSETITAEAAYQAGYQCVLDKAWRAKERYDNILTIFDSYGNICCYDTIIKGMPEFFLHYDAKFSPQDHILTLDYPLIGDVQGLQGIDLIYYYLESIWLEQKLLSLFPKTTVLECLRDYHADYKNLIINIGEVVICKLRKC